MFILIHAINSLSVKDYKTLKIGGNVNFLNHWLQNSGSCRKKKFFPEKTIFKGIIFWYFQTATCYNSSLVLSRLDPALVIAAYNIACSQLNGETLISPLCCAIHIGKSVDPFTTVFSWSAKDTHAQDISSVIATNKLKSKVLKNNTMNGKNLRIIEWMVKEGQTEVPLRTACNEKPFPLIKKEFSKLIFYSLT